MTSSPSQLQRGALRNLLSYAGERQCGGPASDQAIRLGQGRLRFNWQHTVKEVWWQLQIRDLLQQLLPHLNALWHVHTRLPQASLCWGGDVQSSFRPILFE